MNALHRLALSVTLPLILAHVTPVLAAGIEFQAHLEGAGEGPTIVVTGPEHRRANELALTDQLAALEVERGLVLLLTAPDGTPVEDIAAFAGTHLGTAPDAILLNHFGPESYPWVDAPEGAPALAISHEGDWLELASPLFGETVTITVDAGLAPEDSDTLVAALLSREDERLSRRTRWSRQFTTAALGYAGVISGKEFPWSALANPDGKLLALYDAEGVGGAGPRRVERAMGAEQPDLRVMRVCGEDVREGALEAFGAAVFPGGSGRGIVEALEPEGTQVVRDYVAEGGGFLGICAGAYAAGSGVNVYFGIMPLSHAAPWRRGSDHLEVELTPEGIEMYGEEFATFTTRYNNGPVFLDPPEIREGMSDVTVLATFKTPSTDNDGTVREEMVGTPAIGVSTWGAGRVLFISPHPETHEELNSIISESVLHIMP